MVRLIHGAGGTTLHAPEVRQSTIFNTDTVTALPQKIRRSSMQNLAFCCILHFGFSGLSFAVLISGKSLFIFRKPWKNALVNVEINTGLLPQNQNSNHTDISNIICCELSSYISYATTQDTQQIQFTIVWLQIETWPRTTGVPPSDRVDKQENARPSNF